MINDSLAYSIESPKTSVEYEQEIKEKLAQIKLKSFYWKTHKSIYILL